MLLKSLKKKKHGIKPKNKWLALLNRHVGIKWIA